MIVSKRNVEAELGSKEATNETAFLIKKLLKSFQNANFF